MIELNLKSRFITSISLKGKSRVSVIVTHCTVKKRLWSPLIPLRLNLKQSSILIRSCTKAVVLTMESSQPKYYMTRLRADLCKFERTGSITPYIMFLCSGITKQNTPFTPKKKLSMMSPFWYM